MAENLLAEFFVKLRTLSTARCVEVGVTTALPLCWRKYGMDRSSAKTVGKFPIKLGR